MRTEPGALASIFAAVFLANSVYAAQLTIKERTVDEDLAAETLKWANAPADYGPGPGRGRANLLSLGGRKFHVGITLDQPNQVTSPSIVANITLTNPGNYATMPGCSIAAPPTPGGTPASCNAYALGATTLLPTAPGLTAGSGYAIGTILTLAPGSGLTCAIYPTVEVTKVNANGAILALGGLTAGFCSALPTTGTYTFSSAIGSGFTVPVGSAGMRWKILFAATSGGSGYVSPPAVAFSSSPYGAAAGITAVTPAGLLTAPVPVGTPSASVQGFFAPPVAWPINAIHTALLPDGRLLTYGSDQNGTQTGAYLYDIWDPTLGTGPGAHLVLPNFTTTDLFCSGTSVLWTTGQVLISGGDLTINGPRNFSNNQTTILSPATNTIASGAQMQYPRWYGALIPLPTGQQLVLGGRLGPPSSGASLTAGLPATVPEIYTPNVGWTTLTGAALPPAEQSYFEWYYPRAYVTPTGNLFELDSSGQMLQYTLSGAGTVTKFANAAPAGSPYLPTVNYAPGMLLSLRTELNVLVNFNGKTPTITRTSAIDQLRQDASGTLLADGTVLITGGSLVHNVLTGAAYTSQLWNPNTGQFTTGAAATKPRLYHSNAILLPDASVLTLGGGSPGPVVNLNAERYYPPYLYANDGSGNPAPRPTIASVQVPLGGLPVGSTLGFTMADSSTVSRVTLLRMGAATHANDVQQRFFDLTATMVQNGQQISVTLPSNANNAMPGYYMLFAFNQQGVPSVSQKILVTN